MAIYITFEEGTHAAWLYEVLKPYAPHVVVCNPRHNKLIQDGNKSDKIDAYKLAHLLRLGQLTSVYQGEATNQLLKNLVHSYLYLVRDTTAIKNRIKAMYRSRAINCDGETVYGSNREHYLALLTQPGARLRAELLYQQLDSLLVLSKQAHSAMVKQACKHTAYQLLSSIPTLGPVRVAMILAVVVSPHHFRTKRQFWNYIGLAVVTKTSADHIVVNGEIKKAKKFSTTRGLNHNYHRTLKMVFKSAATTLSNGPFKTFYDALRAKGVPAQMARLILARKIAAVTLSVWKKGVAFDLNLLNKHSV
jgi:transposase